MSSNVQLPSPIGQTICNGWLHLPPLSSTQFAVTQVLRVFSEYFETQRANNWHLERPLVVTPMSSTFLDHFVTEPGMMELVQWCASRAVMAAVQVFLSIPCAVWNGAVGTANIVVAYITQRTGGIQHNEAELVIQYGLYMDLVAVIDLVVAAAICTIVLPIGYAIYTKLFTSSTMEDQCNACIGFFQNPSGDANKSWAQNMAYRAMQVILPPTHNG